VQNIYLSLKAKDLKENNTPEAYKQSHKISYQNIYNKNKTKQNKEIIIP